MVNFTIESPQEIVFGFGEKKSLPGMAARFGSRVMVVTGAKSVKESGLEDKIRRLMGEFDLGFVSCRKGEPTCESVDHISKLVRDFSPDSIAAIGGGSVMDTVKAASFMATAAESVEEYLEGNPNRKNIEARGIPWIAIPTTAGTGAEVTKNAVIRSSVQNAKRSVRSQYLVASAVIVDPELTLDLPTRISGITGIDALTQLLESYVSVKSNIYTQSLVRGAFPMMMSALKRVAVNPKDREARAEASYGSLVSGIALANSGLGAVHGFASGIGGTYEIPHGAICASLLVPVLLANAEVIRDKIAFLLSDFPIKKKTDPVSWLVNELTEIYPLFGIDKDLRSYGIDKSSAMSLVIKSKGSSMSGNPKKLTDEELERILLEVI